MPIITISMYPGRTEEQKKEFAAEVTEMAVKILKTKPEHVIVVFDENSKENWFMNGKNL
ncbi:MAG: 4-oxalocrotonate tautomerase family protein [Nitrososphaeraceae archaeon]